MQEGGIEKALPALLTSLFPERDRTDLALPEAQSERHYSLVYFLMYSPTLYFRAVFSLLMYLIVP